LRFLLVVAVVVVLVKQQAALGGLEEGAAPPTALVRQVQERLVREQAAEPDFSTVVSMALLVVVEEVKLARMERQRFQVKAVTDTLGLTAQPMLAAVAVEGLLVLRLLALAALVVAVLGQQRPQLLAGLERQTPAAVLGALVVAELVNPAATAAPASSSSATWAHSAAQAAR
jgi:hypothetical protein